MEEGACPKPVALWQEHARRRRNRWAVLRARVSMAGFRDALMLDHIPPGSRILDVGCGGGRPILATIGAVTGLEPNPELASAARQVYSEVREATADRMPFEQGVFDAVVSTDIIGHIPNEVKPGVFGEMYRVLKPGGVTLHVAEAFSDNWLCRRARKEPEAFQRVWIEEPDHRFVEDADTLVRRFQEAGFKVDWVRAIQGYLPEAGLLAFFLRDQRRLPAWLRCWRWIDRLAGRSDLSREIASLLLTPFALVNRFAKPSQGLGVIVKARK